MKQCYEKHVHTSMEKCVGCKKRVRASETLSVPSLGPRPMHSMVCRYLQSSCMGPSACSPKSSWQLSQELFQYYSWQLISKKKEAKAHSMNAFWYQNTVLVTRIPYHSTICSSSGGYYDLGVFDLTKTWLNSPMWCSGVEHVLCFASVDVRELFCLYLPLNEPKGWT